MDDRPRPALERALRFVAEHLDERLTVAQIARVAHMSEFHFHRVFHDVVGESVARYVTRRRLEMAALRLAYEPARSVTEVALSSGYSSSSNFTKAFTGYFGCSPTHLRSGSPLPIEVGRLTQRFHRAFVPAELFTLPPEPSEEDLERELARWRERVRFETRAEQPLACLAAPEGYDLGALERTWVELIARATQLGLCHGEVDAWGIPHDSPHLSGLDRCRYHACVPCEAGAAVPEPLFAGAMPAGRYAVFSYQGAVSEVADAYRSIYSCWFRRSSVSPADFTPYDHYIGDFPEGGQVRFEIWFRVRPRDAASG
ncbi:AraC family transcriptional regulator [Pseudenhygromyxa sp. WMMC2535]|uniref:AraC family transcriptional regulator n=1 Tax=Pseudenhygromyxa sp. WMMC2535 TaxID=2712867 RepID=UPI0015525502|nr:AraC family transcriptional regulator [Pseudenhygromyxa sp. WMMC2535]NVB37311.1 AraC family transcriptional regulator [Pseudenhygromyxa sp. WMMC2535]